MTQATKKIKFTWKGKDKAGNQVGGEVNAKSEIIARTNLRKTGILAIRIKKTPKPLFANLSIKSPTITASDIAIFTRQLATMLESGVPLVQAFDIIGKNHKNPSIVKMLLSIKIDIEGGNSLTGALRRQPLYFDDLFCSLVEAGERAGVLETLLDKIATYQEKSESIKKKIKNALTYPLAVLAIAWIVTAVLLIFMVPVFEDLFQSFGASLPVFTKFVITLSEWATAWWWVVLLGLLSLFKIYTMAHKHSVKFRHYVDKVLLKIPVVGLMLNKSALARFSRTLATLTAAGIPLVEALESVAGACGNIVYYQAVMKIRKEVATGQRLQFSMQQLNIFPYLLVQMVAIGEESGKIEHMLDKAADFYEAEVDGLADNLSSLIEPVIMLVLGVLVGGLIVAMYLPVFELGVAVG